MPLAFTARNAPDRDIAPRSRGGEPLRGRIEAQRGDVVPWKQPTVPGCRVVDAGTGLRANREPAPVGAELERRSLRGTCLLDQLADQGAATEIPDIGSGSPRIDRRHQ